jgi:hypothetical protein
MKTPPTILSVFAVFLFDVQLASVPLVAAMAAALASASNTAPPTKLPTARSMSVFPSESRYQMLFRGAGAGGGGGSAAAGVGTGGGGVGPPVVACSTGFCWAASSASQVLIQSAAALVWEVEAVCWYAL